MSDQIPFEQKTLIETMTEVSAPFFPLSIIHFEILDTDGVPIDVKKIWTSIIYRIGNRFLDYSENSGPQTTVIFERKVSDVNGSKPLWTSDLQGKAVATSVNRAAEFTLQGIWLGSSHDFSFDVFLVDGKPIHPDPSRIGLVHNVNSDGRDEWTMTLNTHNLVSENSEITLFYQKSKIENGVRRVTDSSFELEFDGEDFRLSSGRYIAVLDYEVDDTRYSTTVEFTVTPEPLTHTMTAQEHEASLNEMMLHRVPWFLIEREGGLNGPFGKIMSYVNSFLARQEEQIDVMSQAWDPNVCPTLFLRYIAWQRGSQLYTRDPGLWRQQAANLPVVLKAKGTQEGLESRLEDCGMQLNDLASYHQVRSARFKTDSWIINPLTEVRENEILQSVKSFVLPLSKIPWFFPDGKFDSNRPSGLFVLESRDENDNAWTSVPLVSGNNVLLSFEQDSSGAWYAVLSPYQLSESGGVVTSLPIVKGFEPGNFTQIRLTYPSAPWGTALYEKKFLPEITSSQSQRSGYCGIQVENENGVFYVFVGGRGNFTTADVWMVNSGTGDASLIPNTSSAYPLPRSGSCIVHYEENKLMMFGGTSISGEVLGDCWVLNIENDLSSCSWTEKKLSKMPSPRSGFSFLEPQASSPSNRKFLIFGGWGDNGPLGDTWEWLLDGDDWSWSEYSKNSIVASGLTNFFDSVPVLGQTYIFDNTLNVYPFQVGQKVVIRQELSLSDSLSSYAEAIVSEIDGTDVSFDVTALKEDSMALFEDRTSYEIVVERSPKARCGASSVTLTTKSSTDTRISFLFGGQLADGSYSNELWCFDYATGWIRLYVANDPVIDGSGSPPARSNALLVPFSGGTGDLDSTLFVCSGLIGAPDEITSGWETPISYPFTLNGISNNCATASELAAQDLFWKLTATNLSQIGWASVAFSGSFDANGSGSPTYLLPLQLGSDRPDYVYEISQDGGTVSASHKILLPPPDKVEFSMPLIVNSEVMGKSSPSPNYTVNTFLNGLLVTAPASDFSTYTIKGQAPVRLPYSVPGSDSFAWDMMSSPRMIQKTIYPALGAWPFPTLGQKPFKFFLDFGGQSFLALQEHAIYEAVEGNEYAAIGFIHNGAGEKVATFRLLPDGTVESELTGTVNSIEYNSDGWFEVSANAFPITMFVEYSDDHKCLLPPIGNYAHIADGWHVLASADPDEYVLSLDIEGELYRIENGSFAIAYNQHSGRVSVWILSETEPEVQTPYSLVLQAPSPRIAPEFPQPIRYVHRVFGVVRSQLENGLVLAQTSGIADSLIDEPSTLWSDIDADTLVQQSTDLLEMSQWKIWADMPNGKRIDYTAHDVKLEKSFSLTDSTTIVKLFFTEGVTAQLPVTGSVLHIVYPTSSSALVCTPGQATVADFGIGDYLGSYRLAQLGNFVKGDKRPCRIDSAKIYEAGFAVVPTVASVFVNKTKVDFTSAPESELPLSDDRAYDGFRDHLWEIAFGSQNSPLWDGGYFVSAEWTSDTDIAEIDDPADPPLFAVVRSVSVCMPDMFAQSWSTIYPFSMFYPVPTVRSEVNLSDLLRVATCQEQAPAASDSDAGLADWAELYILSLPRADIRRVESLNTYKLWKSQVLSGQNPPSVYPSPVIDNDTRLIDRKDPVLGTICGDLQPFPGAVVFGRIRTMVPYGRTIFNKDEFDGSTRPSHNPCDVDVSFVEPCGCCPASHIGYTITLPIEAGLNQTDVKRIVEEFLPAHSIIRFSSLRFSHRDFLRTPVETIDAIVTYDKSDIVMTVNPKVRPDGTMSKSARWVEYLRDYFNPFGVYSGFVSLGSGSDIWWFLDASSLLLNEQPFSGSKSFAIIDSGDSKKIMNGVERLSESALIFTGDEPPTSGHSVNLPTSVYNTTFPRTEAQVSVTSSNVQVRVDGMNAIESGIQIGDKIIFFAGPEGSDSSTGEVTKSSLEILDISVDSEGTWFSIDASDPDDLDNALSSDWYGPRAIGFSISGSSGISSSERKIINQDYKDNRVDSVPRARLERVKKLPQDKFSVTSSSIIDFTLPRTMLRNCYIISPEDKAAFPLAFASGGIIGATIDGVGIIRKRTGEKIAEIKFVSGVATSYIPGESDVNVTSIAYDPQSRKITVVLDSSMSDLILEDFRYASVTEHVETSRTRPSAVIMPRSIDKSYDLDASYFLFYSWDDLSSTSWLPQIRITHRVVTQVNVEEADLENYNVLTGDFIFLQDDDFLNPIQISKSKDGHVGFIVVTSEVYNDPSSTQDVIIGRRIYQTNIGQSALWTKCVKEVEIDVDVLSLVEDLDYSTYETITSASMISINNLTYGITTAAEGSAPGTSLLGLSAYIATSLLPANTEFIVLDMKGQAGDEVGRRMTVGGSEIEILVYDSDGTLVETNRFN